MSVTVKGLFLFFLILILHSDALKHAGYWPAWRAFKQDYISHDGRVVDASSPNMITTSEGQSYALFFALVANDPFMFARLLHWSEENLAAGDLSAQLPAWLWGLNAEKKWGVLDHNSASDADLWMAYDLLEAGRLWNNSHYSKLGLQLLQRIAKEEVVDIPGLGSMLLPGKIGFIEGDNWRLNPSYLPLQLIQRCSSINLNWNNIRQNSLRLLTDTSPKGWSPDWVVWNKNTGWQPDDKQPNRGSYNAIRVYLWVGMLANDVPYKQTLVSHFQPMVSITEQLGAPPEQINVLTGATKGIGPIGFSAALLPIMGRSSALKVQQLRVTASPLNEGNYYNAVLTLFGQGYDDRHYRFSSQGELLPEWD